MNPIVSFWTEVDGDFKLWPKKIYMVYFVIIESVTFNLLTMQNSWFLFVLFKKKKQREKNSLQYRVEQCIRGTIGWAGDSKWNLGSPRMAPTTSPISIRIFVGPLTPTRFSLAAVWKWAHVTNKLNYALDSGSISWTIYYFVS